MFKLIHGQHNIFVIYIKTTTNLHYFYRNLVIRSIFLWVRAAQEGLFCDYDDDDDIIWFYTVVYGDDNDVVSTNARNNNYGS
jgi:hypothetical protein